VAWLLPELDDTPDEGASWPPPLHVELELELDPELEPELDPEVEPVLEPDPEPLGELDVPVEDDPPVEWCECAAAAYPNQPPKAAVRPVAATPAWTVSLRTRYRA